MGYRYRRKGNKERKKERRGRGEGTKGKKQTNKQKNNNKLTTQHKMTAFIIFVKRPAPLSLLSQRCLQCRAGHTDLILGCSCADVRLL